MHFLLAVFSVLFLCLLSTVCDAHAFRKASPAIWLNTSTLAISGRRQATIGILVKNVCPKINELFNKKAPYNFTVSQCDEMQSSLFMRPMKEFCSKLRYMPFSNQLKNIQTLFGLLLGFDSVFPSTMFHDWSTLSNNMDHKLNLNITNRKEILKNSEFKLNQLEASELKESFKVTLLTLEKLIEQHTRNFDENESYLKFLEKLGVNLQKIDNYSVPENSSLISCKVNESGVPPNMIIATLDLATSQMEEFVYEAVPFTMYRQNRHGAWCKYAFSSFGFGFVNSSNVEDPCFSSQRQVSYLDCNRPSVKSQSHFQFAHCSEQTRPIEMLQVKHFNNKPRIYCPGLRISINQRRFEDCPKHVFELTTLDQFKFNESGSKNESSYSGNEAINEKLNQRLFGLEFESGIDDDWLDTLFRYWYCLAGAGLASLLLLCWLLNRCCRKDTSKPCERPSSYVDDEEEYEESEKSPSNLAFLNNRMNYDME